MIFWIKVLQYVLGVKGLKEEFMGFVVDIMGLSVNVMTDKELYSLSGLYLGNDATNIMYMFSVDTLKKVSGNEELLCLWSIQTRINTRSF